MTNEATAHTTITAGRLLCSPLRAFLKEVEFENPEFKWMEGEGTFEREFKVKGPVAVVKSVMEAVEEWGENL